MTNENETKTKTQEKQKKNENDKQKRKKNENATFEGIKPIVLGFFRIGIRFERIPGRSA